MHMADALVSPAVGGAMYAVSAAALAVSAVRVGRDGLGERKIPVMAVTGAFAFAAQMINFTIPGTGSSGHIGGGILLAAMLGGAPALLTITAVLVIQCLLFADGGLLALGCNLFNMGVIPCLVVYPLVFRPLLRRGVQRGRLTAASVLGAVLSLQLGAFSVVLETTASGIAALPFAAFLWLMQPIHLAIGLAEGFVTAGVLVFVWRMRPELLESTQQRQRLPAGVSLRRIVLVLAAAALVTAGGLSLLGSAVLDSATKDSHPCATARGETQSQSGSSSSKSNSKSSGSGISGAVKGLFGN